MHASSNGTHRIDRVEEHLVAYDQVVAQLKSFAALGELDFDLVSVNNGPDPAVAADTLLSLLCCRLSGHEKRHSMDLLNSSIFERLVIPAG
jgi:hypothetical protein